MSVASWLVLPEQPLTAPAKSLIPSQTTLSESPARSPSSAVAVHSSRGVTLSATTVPKDLFLRQSRVSRPSYDASLPLGETARLNLRIVEVAPFILQKQQSLSAPSTSQEGFTCIDTTSTTYFPNNCARLVCTAAAAATDCNLDIAVVECVRATGAADCDVVTPTAAAAGGGGCGIATTAAAAVTASSSCSGHVTTAAVAASAALTDSTTTAVGNATGVHPPPPYGEAGGKAALGGGASPVRKHIELLCLHNGNVAGMRSCDGRTGSFSQPLRLLHNTGPPSPMHAVSATTCGTPHTSTQRLRHEDHPVEQQSLNAFQPQQPSCSHSQQRKQQRVQSLLQQQQQLQQKPQPQQQKDELDAHHEQPSSWQQRGNTRSSFLTTVQLQRETRCRLPRPSNQQQREPQQQQQHSEQLQLQLQQQHVEQQQPQLLQQQQQLHQQQQHLQKQQHQQQQHLQQQKLLQLQQQYVEQQQHQHQHQQHLEQQQQQRQQRHVEQQQQQLQEQQQEEEEQKLQQQQEQQQQQEKPFIIVEQQLTLVHEKGDHQCQQQQNQEQQRQQPSFRELDIQRRHHHRRMDHSSNQQQRLSRDHRNNLRQQRRLSLRQQQLCSTQTQSIECSGMTAPLPLTPVARSLGETASACCSYGPRVFITVAQQLLLLSHAVALLLIAQQVSPLYPSQCIQQLFVKQHEILVQAISDADGQPALMSFLSSHPLSSNSSNVNSTLLATSSTINESTSNITSNSNTTTNTHSYPSTTTASSTYLPTTTTTNSSSNSSSSNSRNNSSGITRSRSRSPSALLRNRNVDSTSSNNSSLPKSSRSRSRSKRYRVVSNINSNTDNSISSGVDSSNSSSGKRTLPSSKMSISWASAAAASSSVGSSSPSPSVLNVVGKTRGGLSETGVPRRRASLSPVQRLRLLSTSSLQFHSNESPAAPGVAGTAAKAATGVTTETPTEATTERTPTAAPEEDTVETAAEIIREAPPTEATTERRPTAAAGATTGAATETTAKAAAEATTEATATDLSAYILTPLRSGAAAAGDTVSRESKDQIPSSYVLPLLTASAPACSPSSVLRCPSPSVDPRVLVASFKPDPVTSPPTAATAPTAATTATTATAPTAAATRPAAATSPTEAAAARPPTAAAARPPPPTAAEAATPTAATTTPTAGTPFSSPVSSSWLPSYPSSGSSSSSTVPSSASSSFFLPPTRIQGKSVYVSADALAGLEALLLQLAAVARVLFLGVGGGCLLLLLAVPFSSYTYVRLCIRRGHNRVLPRQSLLLTLSHSPSLLTDVLPETLLACLGSFLLLVLLFFEQRFCSYVCEAVSFFSIPHVFPSSIEKGSPLSFHSSPASPSTSLTACLPVAALIAATKQLYASHIYFPIIVSGLPSAITLAPSLVSSLVTSKSLPAVSRATTTAAATVFATLASPSFITSSFPASTNTRRLVEGVSLSSPSRGLNAAVAATARPSAATGAGLPATLSAIAAAGAAHVATLPATLFNDVFQRMVPEPTGSLSSADAGRPQGVAPAAAATAVARAVRAASATAGAVAPAAIAIALGAGDATANTRAIDIGNASGDAPAAATAAVTEGDAPAVTTGAVAATRAAVAIAATGKAPVSSTAVVPSHHENTPRSTAAASCGVSLSTPRPTATGVGMKNLDALSARSTRELLRELDHHSKEREPGTLSIVNPNTAATAAAVTPVSCDAAAFRMTGCSVRPASAPAILNPPDDASSPPRLLPASSPTTHMHTYVQQPPNVSSKAPPPLVTASDFLAASPGAENSPLYTSHARFAPVLSVATATAASASVSSSLPPSAACLKNRASNSLASAPAVAKEPPKTSEDADHASSTFSSAAAAFSAAAGVPAVVAGKVSCVSLARVTAALTALLISTSVCGSFYGLLLPSFSSSIISSVSISSLALSVSLLFPSSTILPPPGLAFCDTPYWSEATAATDAASTPVAVAPRVAREEDAAAKGAAVATGKGETAAATGTEAAATTGAEVAAATGAGAAAATGWGAAAAYSDLQANMLLHFLPISLLPCLAIGAALCCCWSLKHLTKYSVVLCWQERWSCCVRTWILFCVACCCACAAAQQRRDIDGTLAAHSFEGAAAVHPNANSGPSFFVFSWSSVQRWATLLPPVPALVRAGAWLLLVVPVLQLLLLYYSIRQDTASARLQQAFCASFSLAGVAPGSNSSYTYRQGASHNIRNSRHHRCSHSSRRGTGNDSCRAIRSSTGSNFNSHSRREDAVGGEETMTPSSLHAKLLLRPKVCCKHSLYAQPRHWVLSAAKINLWKKADAPPSAIASPSVSCPDIVTAKKRLAVAAEGFENSRAACGAREVSLALLSSSHPLDCTHFDTTAHEPLTAQHYQLTDDDPVAVVPVTAATPPPTLGESSGTSLPPGRISAYGFTHTHWRHFLPRWLLPGEHTARENIPRNEPGNSRPALMLERAPADTESETINPFTY